MFSSCLETIEPEGLSDLRGAKADLLRAQTALQEAQAAKVNAEAALKLAEAKVQEAIAAQEAAKVAIIEAEALLAQYQAEYQALVNAAFEAEKAFELEQKIAAAEAAKAEAERAAQVAAAKLEVELLNVQTELLNAQAAYEVAVKNLAAAKVTLTPAQNAYLADFKMEYYKALGEVEDLTAELETAAEDLADAIATVEEQKADKFAIRLAEKAVITAEATLAGAVEAAAIAEAALELDPKVTDWVAEKAELEAELDAMDKAKKEAMLEDEDAAAELEAKYQELKAAYEEYSDATGYSFDENTGEFGVVPGNKTALTAPEIYVPSPKDEDGNNLFGYRYDDFHYAAPEFKYGDADAYGIVTDFENEIDNYAGINADRYEAVIAGNEAQIKAVLERGEDALAQYEDAVAAYKSGDAVSYYKEYEDVWTGERDVYDRMIYADYDVETAVTEYNAAMKAFVAALEKYNTEWAERAPASVDEELAELLEVYNDELAAAEADKWAEYQAARDPYYAASKVWQNAKLAYKRADDVRKAKIDAILELAGYATVADLEAAIAKYVADKAAADAAEDDTFDPEGEKKAKYDKDVAYKADIDKAEKEFDDGDDKTTTDPQSVYDAAEKVWTTAGDTYTKAIAAADKKYDDATAAAKKKYNEAVENLNVGLDDSDLDYVSPMEDNYFTSLWRAFYAAYENYSVKYNAVVRHARVETEYVDMYVGAEDDNQSYVFTVPSYLVDEETQTPKEIKVADVVDVEYFLANTVKSLADNYAAKVVIYLFNAYNEETEKYTSFFPVVIGAPADYPLSLPTYESYSKALEDFGGTAFEYAEDEFRKFENECIASGGYVNYYDWNNYEYEIAYSGYTLDEVFKYMLWNEQQNDEAANIDIAAAHVEVLEAAKAEFEAYVAEEMERIDALRTVVEAEWADNAEAIKAMKDAEIAYIAEMNEIKRVVEHITLMIDTYIGTTNYEYFVSTLEATYAACLEAVDQAEFDLEIANDLLERTKAGNVEAIEVAQAAYDKVAAELAEALAELEAAAEALQDAMVAVGAAEAEEEAPEAPETPAE